MWWTELTNITINSDVCLYLLCDLGGRGGASSTPESGQEFLKGELPSVGVAIEWRSIRGDKGLVKERSRECVGFGGKGISQASESLQVFLNATQIYNSCIYFFKHKYIKHQQIFIKKELVNTIRHHCNNFNRQ